MWIESGGRAKVVKLGNVPHGSHRIGNDPMKLKPPVSGLSSHFILINQFSKQNSRSRSLFSCWKWEVFKLWTSYFDLTHLLPLQSLA